MSKQLHILRGAIIPPPALVEVEESEFRKMVRGMTRTVIDDGKHEHRVVAYLGSDGYPWAEQRGDDFMLAPSLTKSTKP